MVRESEKKSTESITSVGHDDSGVVLRIADREFSNQDLKNFFAAQYAEITMNGQAENSYLLSRLFDSFVENKLILFHAESQDVTVDKAEVQEYLKVIDKQEMKTDPGVVDDLVKVQKHLFFRVYKDISVSDAEIERYYQDNLEDFRRGEEIMLHQILYRDKKKALKTRDRLIHEPQSFEEIARAESEAPDARQGGEMGYFERGQLPKEMESVVFSLKLQEISPVVESPYGFHIFKVTRRKRERLLYLTVVRDEVYNKLLSDKLSRAYEEYLLKLREEVGVSIFHERLFFKYQDQQQGVQQDEKTDLSRFGYFSVFS